MKRFGILLYSLFLLSSLSLFSQEITTQGKRFWVSFMLNYTYTKDLGWQDPATHLIISAKRACSGKIENPNTGWSQTFSVAANGLTEINAPIAQGYSTNVGTVAKKGLLVTSSDTISLYASNFFEASFDVTYVLPEEALDAEYMVQCYPSNEYAIGTQFLIVATENNTVVDITPTADTDIDYHPANQTYSITLNAGETYFANTHSEIGDFSGTTVKARDCKKIAVFNGNIANFVPNTIHYVQEKNEQGIYEWVLSPYMAADHLIEQAIPVNAWGKQFAITNSLGQRRNRVRVTASRNNTQIRRNGTLVSTINAGKTYELEITEVQKSCFLETSEPCAVYLYLVGLQYGDAGDPAMILIPPIEQRIREVTFAAFNTARTTNHNLNIVVNTTDIASVMLDGSQIAPQFTPLAGNADLSFARIAIAAGTHTLSSSMGLIAHAYGHGNYESYGYSVGASAKKLDQAILINDETSTAAGATSSFCKDETIEFKAQLNYTPQSIVWKFDATTTQSGSPVTHAFDSYGTHQVEMIVERPTVTCRGSLYDTVRAEMVLSRITTQLEDTVCTSATYNKNGFSLPAQTASGVYRDTLSVAGCDSVVVLSLFVRERLYTNINHSICEGSSYEFGGGNRTSAGEYRDTLTSVAGCDSVVILTLSVMPNINLTDVKTICSNDLPYKYADTTFAVGTTSGIYTLSRKTVAGCDSIVQLTLRVNQAKQTPLTDEVCQSENYTKNGFALPAQNKAGTFEHRLHPKTTDDCDSTVILRLTVKPIYETVFNERINIGESYEKNGFNIPPLYQVGKFPYVQHLSTHDGCDSTVTLNLTVFVDIVPDKYFTPNDDGINDTWNIQYIEYSDFVSVEIFDRNGKLLKSYYKEFTPWDGTWQGVRMPSTDYWYVIHMPDNRNLTGHFLLKR